MKSKVLSMFLLTAILSIAMVSAAANFTVSPTSLTFAEPATSKTFTITPLVANLTYSFALPTILDKNNVAIPFTPIANLLVSAATTVTIGSTVDYSTLELGKTYTGNLVITEVNNTANTANLPITFIRTFCDSGEQGSAEIGKLEITEVDIRNNDGDDTEWSPLDSIKIEVTIENVGDDKVSDIIVELGLYNSKGKNIVKDLEELDDDQIKLGSLREDDDKTATFTFKAPADFEDSTYMLVIKAYSDDEGEDEVCTSYSSDLSKNYYEIIDGARETDEERQIIVNNVKVSPTNPQCGELVQVSAKVYNIGDEDYEDQVKVTLVNKELGINLEQIIRQDFDQGDSEPIEFEFEIPADAVKKTYVLEFRTYYDYDEDDEEYNIVSDKKFTATLSVEGNCGVTPVTPGVKITAKLSSDTPEAVAGKQVVILATLQNTGSATSLYTVSISGNSAWSSLSEIDSESVVVPAGESRQVSITLDIDADAEGQKEFTIKATTQDGATTEQDVALSVIKTSTSGITGSAIAEHLKANGFIYLIVLINLILIIAIIIVIRRMVVSK